LWTSARAAGPFVRIAPCELSRPIRDRAENRGRSSRSLVRARARPAAGRAGPVVGRFLARREVLIQAGAVGNTPRERRRAQASPRGHAADSGQGAAIGLEPVARMRRHVDLPAPSARANRDLAVTARKLTRQSSYGAELLVQAVDSIMARVLRGSRKNGSGGSSARQPASKLIRHGLSRNSRSSRAVQRPGAGVA